MTAFVIVVIVVAVVVVVAIVASKRRSRDGVDSFRRQIDALSPEARRPVVDQVQSVSEASSSDAEPTIDPDEADDEPGDPEQADDPDDSGRA